MRDDIYASLTVPELVDPRIHSEEMARKEKKHKYLGMYVAELRQAQHASQDSLGVLVRQMKGKVNQS